jgi:hypothetical protein
VEWNRMEQGGVDNMNKNNKGKRHDIIANS